MLAKFLTFFIFLLATAQASPTSGEPPARGDEFLTIMPRDHLAVDPRLRKNVDFWIGIYTRYDTRQGVLHDARHVDKIYEVIDLRRGDGGVRAAKKKWKQVLSSLHHKQKTGNSDLTEDERKVWLMYADIDEPNKFLAASHRRRMRFQLGQKDRFREGLIMSGRYLPVMERIFKAQGLPIELTRLPFVESSFNVKARSKVGASGIWQFMRSTGKLFLTINDAVDERNDPVRATEAAAKLLKMNYESLRSWPLAVTAYNHGRKGMMRAVRKVGSHELGDLVQGYRARTFGFASSNFYTELLAAIEVERNSEKYFGPLEREKPMSYVDAKIPDFIRLKDLARFLKLDMKVIRQLNPGLTQEVFKGRKLVPAGYQLRLPYKEGDELARESTLRVFFAGYAQIPDSFKLRAQRRVDYGRRVMSQEE